MQCAFLLAWMTESCHEPHDLGNLVMLSIFNFRFPGLLSNPEPEDISSGPVSETDQSMSDGQTSISVFGSDTSTSDQMNKSDAACDEMKRSDAATTSDNRQVICTLLSK